MLGFESQNYLQEEDQAMAVEENQTMAALYLTFRQRLDSYKQGGGKVGDEIVLYTELDFKGQSRTLKVGSHQIDLFSLNGTDFRSIQIPEFLSACIDHGGLVIWDLFESTSDLGSGGPDPNRSKKSGWQIIVRDPDSTLEAIGRRRFSPTPHILPLTSGNLDDQLYRDTFTDK
jgi:uncharacterized Zn ribbon protein